MQIPNDKMISVTSTWIPPLALNFANGNVPGILVHNQAFAKIPNTVKHKVALCLNFKFLPKKNIVKKLYIFFNVFWKNSAYNRECSREYTRARTRALSHEHARAQICARARLRSHLVTHNFVRTIALTRDRTAISIAFLGRRLENMFSGRGRAVRSGLIEKYFFVFFFLMLEYVNADKHLQFAGKK